MALKAIVLGAQITLKKRALEKVRADLKAMEQREAELAAAVEEVTNEEEMAAIEESVNTLTEEKKGLDENAAGLEKDIESLEQQLREEEAKQEAEPPAPTPAPQPVEERSKKKMNTDERIHIQTRDRVFAGMTRAEQHEMIQREDVKNFLSTVKATMGSKNQTRAINNVGLLIPEVMLGLIRDNVLYYSKLRRHVTVGNIQGEGVELFADEIPEAVWTECCANLNELSMGFYQGRYGCFKQGGFFVVCNANLEDSDLDLMAEILSTLGQSLAYTDDKTIVYGTGTNMPLGIVPRLAQESQPAGYPATARPWVDLHTTNIKTIANSYTGLALFQQIILAAGNAKSKNAAGGRVWAMNEFTKNFLMAQAMNIDASGAITAGINGTMPVLGGVIEELPDSIMPDYNILMGYMDHYRIMERAGTKFATSEEYFFLNDQTVFKATARWDGHPTIPESFVLIGLNGVTPTTSVTFRADGANTPTAVLLPATASVKVGQKINLIPTLLPYGVDTAYTWTSGTAAKATVSAGEVTGVAAGSSVITVTTENGLTAQCTVTVTAD